MGDADVVACVSKKLEKVFENVNAKSGYIAGWQEDKSIFCVSCATEVDFFLCGLNPIGYFYFSEKLLTEHEVMCISQTLQSTKKIDTADILILFVEKKIHKDDISITISSKLYSSYYDTVKPVNTLISDIHPMLFRVTGHIPFVFEATVDAEALKEGIESAVEKLKSIFSSDVSAFHIKDSNVLLLSNLIDDCLCKRMWEKFHIENSEGSQIKSKKSVQTKVPLDFEFLLQTSGEAAIENTVNHTLVIHCQRRKFQCVSQYLPLDVIVSGQPSSRASDLYKLLVKGILLQLEQMSQCLLKFAKVGEFICPKPYHFYPDIWNYPVTLIYPEEKSDTELLNYRKILQEQLLLPLDMPYLRKCNQYLFSNGTSSGYLINPHIGLSASGVPGGKLSLVRGQYAYHHYMQDRMNDDGWGCAYRSLQTIISWFKLQGYVDTEVPTHVEIQKALVEVGDKQPSFVGSKQWIGSQEVSFCLDHLLKIKSKIIFVNSGAELADKGRELSNHFRDQGTPIMIGGGLLAHTILGVDFNQSSGELRFLILDPHYKGGEDLAVIQNKGWCGWKKQQFWDQTAFYNLCLPQRPAEL